MNSQDSHSKSDDHPGGIHAKKGEHLSGYNEFPPRHGLDSGTSLAPSSAFTLPCG